MTTAYVPQSASDTLERITAGVDPWIAYRDFLEDWTYLPESRCDLAGSPPVVTRSEDLRWAALLAATVEVLCGRDGLPVPEWTRDPEYVLADPWYLYEGTGRMRDWLRRTTPPRFAERNIWSGDRLLRRT